MERGKDVKLFSNVLGGVNAFNSNGELVVDVFVDIVDAVVTGVIGKKEKLFEEDFAGLMVVEWRMVPPGSRVILKGRD